MSALRITARRTITLGAIVALGGALLVIFLPSAVDALFVSAALSRGQEIQAALEVVLRVASSILPPLGAALIGAGLVMAFHEQAQG